MEPDKATTKCFKGKCTWTQVCILGRLLSQPLSFIPSGHAPYVFTLSRSFPERFLKLCGVLWQNVLLLGLGKHIANPCVTLNHRLNFELTKMLSKCNIHQKKYVRCSRYGISACHRASCLNPWVKALTMANKVERRRQWTPSGSQFTYIAYIHVLLPPSST